MSWGLTPFSGHFNATRQKGESPGFLDERRESYTPFKGLETGGERCKNDEGGGAEASSFKGSGSDVKRQQRGLRHGGPPAAGACKSWSRRRSGAISKAAATCGTSEASGASASSSRLRTRPELSAKARRSGDGDAMTDGGRGPSRRRWSSGMIGFWPTREGTYIRALPAAPRALTATTSSGLGCAQARRQRDLGTKKLSLNCLDAVNIFLGT